MSLDLNLNLDSELLTVYLYKNLDNLSNIKEGCKIYINNENNENIITPDEPYMFQGLWRYYHNISRADAILVITKLFDNIERYFNSLYIKICMCKNKKTIINMSETFTNEFNLIIEKMNKSIQGIENLKLTYKDDTTTVDNLNNIIINVNNMINNFTKLNSTIYLI